MWFLLIVPVLYLCIRNNSKVKLFIITSTILLKVLWLSLLQKLNKSVTKINKNKYEISYMVGNKLYKFHCLVARGPTKVLQIIDKNSNDVTNIIKPFVGPNYDFHNLKYTPNDFNYNELTFQLADGTDVTFTKLQTLKL